MACNHTDHYNQSHNIELVHDTENRSFKSIEPPIHQVAGEQTKTQQQQDQTQTLNPIKKCHGNRKLQHFKRKCRARGLSEEQITTVIHQNNRTISEQSPTDPTIFEQPHPSSKRKRDALATDNSLNTSMKSKSQLSLAAAKKLKHSTKYQQHVDMRNKSITAMCYSESITYTRISTILYIAVLSLNRSIESSG